MTSFSNWLTVLLIAVIFLIFWRGRPLTPSDWRFVCWKEPWGKVLGALPKDFFRVENLGMGGNRTGGS